MARLRSPTAKREGPSAGDYRGEGAPVALRDRVFVDDPATRLAGQLA
jgi:hypothetical protein